MHPARLQLPGRTFQTPYYVTIWCRGTQKAGVIYRHFFMPPFPDTLANMEVVNRFPRCVQQMLETARILIWAKTLRASPLTPHVYRTMAVRMRVCDKEDGWVRVSIEARQGFAPPLPVACGDAPVHIDTAQAYARHARMHRKVPLHVFADRVDWAAPVRWIESSDADGLHQYDWHYHPQSHL